MVIILFSSIFAFFKKLEEFKLKKQKKETKKELKKEESKSNEDIITAKENARKSKKVIEGKEKEKKSKIKILILTIFEWITTIIEQFIAWLISLVGIYGFFIILAVLVIMIAIYGLLHIDLTIIDSIFNNSNEECIDGSSSMASVNYDFDSISQVSGAMSEHKKNLVRFLGIYKDYMARDDIYKNPKYIEEVTATLGADKVFDFMCGFSFCETGGYFKKGYTFNGEEDILSYSTDIPSNGAGGVGYCFLGLQYGDTFDTKYGSAEVSNQSFIDYVKNKYSPKDFKVTDNNYVPYGAATQMSSLGTTYMSWNNSLIDEKLPGIMDKYGISANRDKLTAYCKMFMGAAAYHSLFSGQEDLLSIWCALWSATSQNDSERTFDNISVVYQRLYLNEQMYGEPQARKYIFGNGGKNDLVVHWDEKVDETYFEINGKPIDVTLWTWVRDNCSNKDAFMASANNYLIHKGGKEEVNNAHYGLFSYLIVPKIVKDLGGSVPVSSGGTADNCDCVEGTSNIGNMSIESAKINGDWPSDVQDKMLEYETNGNKWSQYFGQAYSINSSNEKMGSTSMTFEEWLNDSKWKVPYQVQYEGSLEVGKGEEKVKFGPIWHGNGCHIYMSSYIASALTGKFINFTEMFAALRATGGIVLSGEKKGHFQNASANVTFEKLGIYWVGMDSSGNIVGGTSKEKCPILYPSGKTAKEKVDAVLETGGIVGVRTLKGNYTGSGHYFVITEKVGDKYKTASFSHPGNDIKPQSWEFIVGVNGSDLGSPAFYLAYKDSSNSTFIKDSTVVTNKGGSANNFGTKVNYSGGTEVEAYFTAYCPFGENVDRQMEGGLNDCMGNPLDPDSNTLAKPNIESLPYGVTIVIDGTGTDLDGKVFYGKDHGGAIKVDADGRYHFDVLVADAATMNTWSNPSGKAYINPQINGYVGQSQTVDNCAPSFDTQAAGAFVGLNPEERWKLLIGEDSFNKYFESSWTSGVKGRKSSKWKTYRDTVYINEVEKVTVKAWDYDSNKNWVDYEFDILVHKNLAGVTKAVFDELYALPEKDRTPIHNSVYEATMGGIKYRHNGDCFAWGIRGDGSIHCIGAAFDLNIDENPMPGQYGDIRNYKPGVDPYSISDDSALCKIFEKYGLERGRTYSDYMHFSLLESVAENNKKYSK